MMRRNLVVIGSSTGGPKILEEMLPTLPVLNAAVVIVQHITPTIDRSLAASLARISAMPVSLARDGQALNHGEILMAPGGLHLTLVNNSRIRLLNGERVNSVCPAIDVAMKSLENPAGARLVGVILTGMGRDGAEGLRHVKGLGGATVAQNQASSVIFGMPRAAIETGCVDQVLSTAAIGKYLREMKFP